MFAIEYLKVLVSSRNIHWYIENNNCTNLFNKVLILISAASFSHLPTREMFHSHH